MCSSACLCVQNADTFFGIGHKQKKETKHFYRLRLETALICCLPFLLRVKWVKTEWWQHVNHCISHTDGSLLFAGLFHVSMTDTHTRNRNIEKHRGQEQEKGVHWRPASPRRGETPPSSSVVLLLSSTVQSVIVPLRLKVCVCHVSL